MNLIESIRHRGQPGERALVTQGPTGAGVERQVLNPDSIDSPTQTLLATALSFAVPLWIDRLRDREVSYILERAQVCGSAVSERGDILQFKSKKRGASAEVFNRCAEGLACLALTCPGGVTFLGMHFDARDRGPSGAQT